MLRDRVVMHGVFSSCNSRKDAADICGKIATLRMVVEEVKEEVNAQQFNEY